MHATAPSRDGETRVLRPGDAPSLGRVAWVVREITSGRGVVAFAPAGTPTFDRALARVDAGADAVLGIWRAEVRSATLGALLTTPSAGGYVVVRGGARISPPGGVPDAFLDDHAPWCIGVLVAAAGGRVDLVPEDQPAEPRVTPKGRAWLVTWAIDRVGPGALSRRDLEAVVRGRSP
jgi:hypothetical protein